MKSNVFILNFQEERVYVSTNYSDEQIKNLFETCPFKLSFLKINYNARSNKYFKDYIETIRDLILYFDKSHQYWSLITKNFQLREGGSSECLMDYDLSSPNKWREYIVMEIEHLTCEMVLKALKTFDTNFEWGPLSAPAVLEMYLG